MSVFPTFRHRKLTRRDYTLLHDDSDASQYSESPRSSLSRRRTTDGAAPALCDRCWIQRERTRATKRCLDCKQNLCTVCARCDEITRPWWLPSIVVQCWRFLFTKAFIPHSIVELNDDTDDRPHWALSQEASHVHRIPRLTRTSLRSSKGSTSKNIQDEHGSNSNTSTPSVSTGNRPGCNSNTSTPIVSTGNRPSCNSNTSTPGVSTGNRPGCNSNTSTPGVSTGNRPGCNSNTSTPSVSTGNRPEDIRTREGVQGDQDHLDFIARSRSFEGVKSQSKLNLKARRSRSAERIPNKHNHVENKRDSMYEHNWKNANYGVSSTGIETNCTKADSTTSFGKQGRNNQEFSRKMIGKDINIELTGEQIKLSVNEVGTESEVREKCKVKNKCLKHKRKQKEKLKTPDPYTEQLFDGVPIWFKKSPSGSRNEREKDKLPKPYHENGGFTESSSGNIHRNSKQTKENENFNFQRSSLNNNTANPISSQVRDHESANVLNNEDGNFQRPRLNDTNVNVKEMPESEPEQPAKNYIVEEPGDLCPICLEELPGIEARLLSCSHSIHTKCLVELLHRMDLDFGIRCPVCSGMTMIRNYYAPREQWYKELSVSTTV